MHRKVQRWTAWIFIYLTLLRFYGNNIPFSPSLRNFVDKAIVLGCYCSERVEMLMLVIADLVVLFLNNSGDNSCKGRNGLCKPVFIAFWNLLKLLPTGHRTSSRESALRFLLWCSTLYNTAEVSQEVGAVLIGRSFSLLSLLGIWGIQWKFSTFCF